MAQEPWLKDGLLALLLMVTVVVVYWPALHGDFIWDDDKYVSANEMLRSWGSLWDIWFKPHATGQYYPLTFTVFSLGYHLWGLNPLGFHLLTVLFHGLVAVLLWHVLKRLEVRAAWLAGAIFAMHPVNVMSVAWMTELKNTLSGSLMLGAVWAYLRFSGLGVYETTARPRADWRYGVLSLALFQLAMFAKTAVSFLPVTLLLLVWWKRERIVWRDVWLLLLMLGIAVGMGQLTIHVEHLQGATGDEFRMNLLNRVLISGRSFWFYLGKLFVPYKLTFIYERWKIDAGAWWQYVYPVATLAALGTLWRLRRRIGKAPFVAMMHFYIATSMLVLIQMLYMMRYSFVTDHWQYFGCMSVIAMAAVGIVTAFDFVKQGRLPLTRAFCGALLLVLGVLTWRQCGMYADVETLWRTTIARNPDAFLAYNNLGYILLQKGRVDEATNQFQKALEIQPDYDMAHNNLGYVFLQKGQVDEAIAHYQKILESHPDNPSAHYNLGIALVQKGQVDEAIAQYQIVLKTHPNDPNAHYNLGIALVQKGRVDEAIAHYQRALEIQPDDPKVYNNLGIAFAQKGLADKAIAQFRKAVEIQPEDSKACNNLGNALFRNGRLDESIVQFRKAVEIQPDYTDARHNLGLALAQKGLVDEAIAQFKEVLRFKPDDRDTKERLRALGVPVPE